MHSQDARRGRKTKPIPHNSKSLYTMTKTKCMPCGSAQSNKLVHALKQDIQLLFHTANLKLPKYTLDLSTRCYATGESNIFLLATLIRHDFPSHLPDKAGSVSILLNCLGSSPSLDGAQAPRRTDRGAAMNTQGHCCHPATPDWLSQCPGTLPQLPRQPDSFQEPQTLWLIFHFSLTTFFPPSVLFNSSLPVYL